MAANSTTITVSIYIVINEMLWFMPHRITGNINWESTDSEDV